jgi:hypothetical protein
MKSCDFAPEKKMAVCACAQTAIIALTPLPRQTQPPNPDAVKRLLLVAGYRWDTRGVSKV